MLVFGRIIALAVAGVLRFASAAGADDGSVPKSYAGYVSGSGAILAGSGFAVTHLSAGTYLISYPASKFPAGFPAMTITGFGQNGIVPVAILANAMCVKKATCTFQVTIVNSTTQLPGDNGFVFTIVQAK